MADEDDIVQKIRVEVEEDGGSSFNKLKSAAQEAFDGIRQIFQGDIGGAFDNIKDAGTKAFESFKDGATQAGQSLSNLKDIGSGAFSEIGEIAAASAGRIALVLGGIVTGLALAFGALGKIMLSFSEDSAKSVNVLGDLADKTHSTIQGVSELETAFAHAGTSASEFASGYSKLSDVVNSTWEKIKKETETGLLDIESKSIAAEKAAQRLVDTQRTASGDKPNLNDTKVEESRAKDLALREAELANTKAQKAERDEQMNDIRRVTAGVQDLISGNSDALKSFNATADNIVQGVVAAAGKSSDALKGLGDGFAAVGSRAPDVKDVLTALGQALVSIKDPALQSEVALKALGKSGESFLSAFKSGNLDEFIEKVHAMGGALDDTNKKIADNFRGALTGLGQDLDNVKDKFGAAFGPGFTDIFKTLDDFLVRNQDNVQRFADLIASVLMPPLKLAAIAFMVIGEAANATFDILRNLFKIFTDIIGLKGLAILEDLKNLYNILTSIAEVLTGNVKKGLEDLSKERHQEAEADKAADKRADDEKQKKAADKVPPPLPTARPPEAALTDAEKIQRVFADSQKTQKDQQQRQDAQDRQLADDFKKFQESQPKNRFEGTSLTPEQRNAADFQRFQNPPQRQPQSQSEGTSFSDAASKSVDQIKSVLETIGSTFQSILKNGIGEAKASESPEGLRPQTTSPEERQRQPLDQGPQPPTTPAPETNVVLDQLINLFRLLTPSASGDKVQGPATGLGIRGDAQDTGAQTVSAEQDLAGSAQKASTALDGVVTSGQQIATIGDAASGAGSSLQSVGSAADGTVSPLQSLQAAAQSAAQALQSVKGGGGQQTAEVSAAEGGHIRGPGSETSDSIPAWLSHNEFVQPAKAVRHYGLAFMEAIRRTEFPKYADGGLVSILASAPRFAGGGLAGNGEAADAESTQKAFDVVINYIKDIYDKMRGLSQRIDNLDNKVERLGNSKSGSVEVAEGGHIRGPGTATSDSIAAWLSDNEFVQPAKATQHYGVAFMEAVRTLQFPKFSAGGLVGLMSPQMPRFAAGGPVTVPSGGTMQHLGTVDLTTDHGTVRVATDSNGIRQLRRASVIRNIGSPKKPSWVG